MWNDNEKKPIWQYLGLTFLIAWVCEAILILGERLGILTGTVGVAITFIVIGLGAGFAPAYATIILLKKHGQLHGWKDLCGRIFSANHGLKSFVILFVFFCSQLTVQILCSDYSGAPWYLFILYLPVMIFGGGIEEIGWRGFFQPALEEKFPFFAAGFITGVVWAVWHFPLWFIQNANQSSMNFLSFLLGCIVMAFVFAALYKLTKSVFACILLHAWSNVLSQMFTMDMLTKQPDIKLIALYAIEIIASILIFAYADKRNQKTASPA